jgi:hypothetical protein
MSQHYAFRLYSPRPVLTRERVGALLRGFASNGFRVTNYSFGGTVQHVPADAVFEPEKVIATDGSCLVSLNKTDAAGYTRFLFQAYAPEAKGAQANLAVDEDIFDANPTVVGSWLLELAKIVNLHLPIFFGWGDHEIRLEQLEDGLRFDRIGALAWANLFGPEMVRRIGVEQLRALPIHQVQVFKQGALCLLTPIPGQPLTVVQADQIEAQWPGCRLPLGK